MRVRICSARLGLLRSNCHFRPPIYWSTFGRGRPCQSIFSADELRLVLEESETVLVLNKPQRLLERLR